MRGRFAKVLPLVSLILFFLFTSSIAWSQDDDAAPEPEKAQVEDSDRKPAEFEPPPPPRTLRRKTRGQRRATSAEDEAQPEETDPREGAPRRSYEKSWSARVALLAGYATVSTNVTSLQTNWTTGGYNYNYYLGLSGDVEFAKYFGAEMEGFYNIAPAKSASGVYSTATTTYFLRQVGFMGGAKLQYPYSFQNGWKIVPRAGVGFAFLGLNAFTSNVTSSSTGNNASVNGVYLSAGADVKFANKFTFGIDYAITVIAAGGIEDFTIITTSTTPTTDSSSALQSGGVQRFRVGATYHFNDTIFIGAQFILRLLTYLPSVASGATSNTTSTVDTMTQIVGLVGASF